jgi:hypothetical protein
MPENGSEGAGSSEQWDRSDPVEDDYFQADLDSEVLAGVPGSAAHHEDVALSTETSTVPTPDFGPRPPWLEKAARAFTARAEARQKAARTAEADAT